MRMTYLLVPVFAVLLAGCGPDADDRVDEPEAMPPSAEPGTDFQQQADPANRNDPAPTPGAGMEQEVR